MANTLRVPLYPAEQAAKPATVCVTGASGYVGSVLVKRLLAAGHSINATVRNLSDQKKVSHLTSLDGASDRLKLFKADLTDPDSFDAAIAGCQYVFHVASPFVLSVPKSQVQEKLVGPAVSGVEAVLNAVSRAGDAEVVVLTSSIVAMVGDQWEHGKDHVLTENDWDNSASAGFLPYPYSKTVAEKKAWEMYENQQPAAGKKKWELRTINPGFVLGPPLSLSGGESIEFCQMMMDGKFRQGLPKIHLAVVDVEDVAAAHVLAALTPTANGRYLCASEATDFQTLVKDCENAIGGDPKPKYAGPSPPKWLLWVLCKVFKVADWDTTSAGLGKPLAIDNNKIKNELGVGFVAGGKSLADMVKKIEELRGASSAPA